MSCTDGLGKHPRSQGLQDFWTLNSICEKKTSMRWWTNLHEDMFARVHHKAADSMTSFLEIPYPQDHWTLQWKGLNLYSRGRILKNSQFWGVRILRILRVGKFLSKINSLTGDLPRRSWYRHRRASTIVAVADTVVTGVRSEAHERSRLMRLTTIKEWNTSIEFRHLPISIPISPKENDLRSKLYDLRFWIAFQDGW